MSPALPPTGTARPAGATGPPAVPGTGRAVALWWRRAWIWCVLAGVLLLVALPSMLRQGPDSRQLAPDAAQPQGARAVVRVLQAHGVTVHPADSLGEALALAAEHPEAPVLVHDPARHLPANGLEKLAAAVAPERRVLVEPDFTALGSLAPGVSQAGQVPEGDPLAAGSGCTLQLGREAASVVAEGRSYRVDDGGRACFPVPGTANGSTDAAHALVETADGTLVIGNHRVLANGGADLEGHPVLSLWSLGRSSDVVWYLPGLDDLALDPAPPTLDELLPGWVRPAGIWLLVCLVVLLFWRGRRHGPLAVEPLPVVVPASETAVGRARLYERTGQHAAAARALRSATLVRLSRMLRLGHGASVDAVVSAAAGAIGREPSRVSAALDVEHVSAARDLVAAAGALQDLEDAVHRALAPGTGTDRTAQPTHAAQPSPANPTTPRPAPRSADGRTP
jgi:hypothetical protein